MNIISSKYIFFFVLLILLQHLHVAAQKQNNIWLFGNHAGLDFNFSPPRSVDYVPVTGNFPYYTSTIADSLGNLLFSTDGFITWNRNFNAMKKYKDRWPWSGHVLPLICPYPGNDSLYYIFGVSDDSYANRLQYLTIDMTGNGGYGEIVYPQPSTLSNYFTVLLNNASVLLAGTAHCNKKDVWIVTHSQDAFYSFLVTEKGVDSVPVISKIPTGIVESGAYGTYNIKFSPSGEKLVMQIGTKAIAVFDFDNSIGAFTNGIRLDMPKDVYLEDVEISPDGNRLYYGAYVYDKETYNDDHYVYQMDLTVGSPDAIAKTTYPLIDVPDRGGGGGHLTYIIKRCLQLAPDGKIYVSMREVIADVELNLDNTASLIEAPNELGVNARYTKNSVDINKKYKFIQVNYIRSSSFPVKQNGIQFSKNICNSQPVNFSLLLSKVDSVKWNFGDPASGNNNSSQDFKPSHIYPAPGSYLVTALIYNRCITDTALATVVISPEQPVKIPASIKDSTVCSGEELFMNATTPYATGYMWGGGNINPIQQITVNGKYEIRVTNDCSIDVRTFNVQFKPCDCEIFIPAAFTPNSDGLNDLFRPIVKCNVQEYLFKIFSRYGQVIFDSSKPGAGWNGTIANQPLPTGTYVWLVQYRDPNSKLLVKKHGTVTLIR